MHFPAWHKQIPKYVKKSIKIGPQIDRNCSQNQSKIVQNSAKISAKALLERSGRHVGPKMAPRAKILQNVKIGGASWAPTWGGLGPTLGHLGSKLGGLGPILAPSWGVLGRLGLHVGRFWPLCWGHVEHHVVSCSI